MRRHLLAVALCVGVGLTLGGSYPTDNPSGGGGGGGPHASTHVPGGTDEIPEVLRARELQTETAANPYLSVQADSSMTFDINGDGDTESTFNVGFWSFNTPTSIQNVKDPLGDSFAVNRISHRNMSETLTNKTLGAGTKFGFKTTDPCATEPEGYVFYNDTSDCFCNGAGADVQMHAPTTACF